jgi:serine phosphatase RsbU (regulator of sigma subunit)
MATPWLVSPPPPSSAPRAPASPGFGCASWCRGAMGLGGDLCEVTSISEHSLLIVVADVMGKGILAALFASSLRSLVRALAEPGVEPAGCLAKLNQLMFEQLSSAETFITAQVAVVDLRRRQLVVGNAGHCPLLLSDGALRLEAIAPHGLPLGVQKDAVFAEQCAELPPFASALFYTDGITEARNPAGELFGQDRLERWFASGAADRRTATELKRSLLLELDAFRGQCPADDDQTFIIISDENPRREPAMQAGRARFLGSWAGRCRPARGRARRRAG